MQGFGEIAERLRRSAVQVFSDRRRGGGSGVAWSSDGLIITNAHVARGKESYQVELWDGRRFPARIVSQDPRRDLAALRIDASLPAVSLGDSDRLRPGEIV